MMDLMKEYCLIMILITSFTLVVPTIAEPERFTLGAYTVSFDMGIDELTNWVVNEPIFSESMDGSLTFTKYTASVDILTESQFNSELKRLGHSPSTHFAFINVIQYNSTKDESVNGTKTAIESVLNDCTGITLSKRTIDGKRGTIGSGTGGNGIRYAADWWMENNTAVFVLSFFPWDEGTLQLLKTIHVERNTTG